MPVKGLYWKRAMLSRCRRIHPLPYLSYSFFCLCSTLIKKKIKFSSYIRKSRMEQLQSHIWLTAPQSSYVVKYMRISSYIRKSFLIYDFETGPLWISLYVRKIWFFYQCRYCLLNKVDGGRVGWGSSNRRRQQKSVGFFLYTPFTGIHKGSVVDQDSDSALYLITGVGSGFREPNQCGSIRIWIRVHPDRGQNLLPQKVVILHRIILYVGIF